jgi:hypothetical protein
MVIGSVIHSGSFIVGFLLLFMRVGTPDSGHGDPLLNGIDSSREVERVFHV